jgi:hypothetical protein
MAFHRGPKTVTDGLVLYLDAANPKSYVSGSTVWRDLISNQISGSLINGPTFDTGSNGSIQFDGVDDYVNISTTPNLTNPLTVCAFVNTSVVTGSNQVIYGPSANGSDNWFSINNNRLQLYATQDADLNNIQITGNTVIKSNIWYYLTGIVNNNIISTYINGVLESVSSPQGFTFGGWNSTTRIGQRATGQFPFNGRIAYIQGYNRALTAEEVLQNYNATKSRFGL